MSFQRAISIIIGLCFFGIAVALWAKPDPETATTGTLGIKRVCVTPAAETVFQREIRFPGITRSAHRASLSFTVPGRMVINVVDIGQTVNKGALIARLDEEQFHIAVHSAEAKLSELQSRTDQANRDRRRIALLVSEKAATDEELEKMTTTLEALQAGLKMASAQLNEARRQLREATLKAPFTGTITAVLTEPGEWIVPGKPVVEMSGNGKLELEVQVPETIVTKIHNGQTVMIEFPFVDATRVVGHIVSVADAAAGAGRLFPVLIRFPSKPGLSAGLTAELIVSITEEKRISVPLNAIVNPGASRPALFRVVDDRVERVSVELGRIADGRVAVSGSLNAGDLVVVSGHTSLAAGDHVEVRQ